MSEISTGFHALEGVVMIRHLVRLAVIAVMCAPTPAFSRSPLADSTDVQISSALEVENSVFISPIDPNFILVGHNTAVPVGSGTQAGVDYWISTDAGNTWSSNFASPLQTVDPVAAISGNPLLPQGRFIAAFYKVDQAVIQLQYKDSPSASWSSVVPVGGAGADKPHLWVDNSLHSSAEHRYHLYSAWTESYKIDPNDPGTLVFDAKLWRSTNNGINWGSEQLLDHRFSPDDARGVNIQTGRTGRVYAIWQRTLGTARLGFSESNEDALPNFEMRPSIGLAVGTPNPYFPSMTVDKSDSAKDHLYVVWASSSQSAVKIMKGSAQLAGSPTPQVVWDTSNIGTVNAGPGHLPWITWDECTGMLAVVWLDKRNALGRETYVATAQTRDANGAFLTANNLDWTGTFKVSDTHWITSNIPTPGYDYIGIAASDGRAFPVWSDDRLQDSAYRPYVSRFLLWGIEQSSVTATPVNNGNGTLTVTATWSTNLPATVNDQIVLLSPNGVEYTSSACNTCGGSDGRTHTVVFSGVACEPGTWTYTVRSQRTGCTMSRTSDTNSFFVAPNVSLTGQWPASSSAIAKCPGGDPTSYNYTVDTQFQGSCVSTVAKGRITLEALAMNPSLRKLAFFPQSVQQPADFDVTSTGGYATTITEHQVGGCGSDSARVYLDGVAVGKAFVPFIANVDLNGTGSVDAGDLSLFATVLGTYPGHPNYDPCANFAGSDHVDAADLSAFALHLGHSWNNPLFKAGGAGEAATRLRLEPGSPAGSMNVALRLEGVDGRSAFGVVLRPTTSSLRFQRWLPANGYETTTAAFDTMDAQGRRLTVLALDFSPDASGDVELGNLIFTTSSPGVGLNDLPISYEDVAARGTALASTNAAGSQGTSNPHLAVLHQNQPNPFNPRTTIRYSLERDMNVRLTIFDVTGRLVRTLVDAQQVTGDHVVVSDGRDEAEREVGTGIYMYQLTAGDLIETKKLVIIR